MSYYLYIDYNIWCTFIIYYFYSNFYGNFDYYLYYFINL